MLAVLSQYGWIVLFRRIRAIPFGVATIAGRKDPEDWLLLLLQDGIGIAFGALTLHAPAISAVALVTFVAACALRMGGARVVPSFRPGGRATKATA